MQCVRRAFLTYSTFLGVALLCRHNHSVAASGPNQKLNIACVGVGGAGGNFLRDKALAAERFVAFAEVDDREGKPLYDLHPDVPRYKD